MKLNNNSASELVSLLANRIISAVELMEQTIARIESQDEKINAMPVRDFERARELAKKADADLAKGLRKPLLGLLRDCNTTWLACNQYANCAIEKWLADWRAGDWGLFRG